MHHLRTLSVAALLAGILASSALAASLDGLDGEPAAKPKIAIDTPAYKLDEEMIVKNWVLCVSQPSAESLVRAREHSAENALKTYGELKAAKACGQFPELLVVLQKAVYEAPPATGHDAKVFGALIKFSGAWANGFVVYGGMPE